MSRLFKATFRDECMTVCDLLTGSAGSPWQVALPYYAAELRAVRWRDYGGRTQARLVPMAPVK